MPDPSISCDRLAGHSSDAGMCRVPALGEHAVAGSPPALLRAPSPRDHRGNAHSEKQHCETAKTTDADAGEGQCASRGGHGELAVEAGFTAPLEVVGLRKRGSPPPAVGVALGDAASLLPDDE